MTVARHSLSTSAEPPTRAVAAVLLATLVALGLRLLRLDVLGDLEFDEIVSMRYAALAPDQLLATLSGALFEHPPLYYLLLGGWLSITSVTPASAAADLLARTLSIFPGTLLVPLTYSAGARLVSRRAGVAAALLVAVSPLPLFYSREARMYELTACLAVGASWLYARSAARPTSGRRWVVFGLTGIAVALVHYAGVLVILAQPISRLASSRPMQRRYALAAVAAVLVAAGWWAGVASGVRGSLPALDVAFIAGVPAGLWQVWRETAAGPEAGVFRGACAGIALAALTVGGARALPSLRSPVLLSLLAGLLAVAIALLLGKPAQARYGLVAAPFVSIVVGAAIASRMPASRALLTVVVLVGIAPWAVPYYTSYRRADYSDVTRFIAAHERPDDAILLTGPWQAWYFDYFYPRAGGTLLHAVIPENAPPALDPARAATSLADLTRSRRRLWFVQAGLAQADPTNFVEGWLRRNGWPSLRQAHQNAVLSLYLLEPPETTRPLRSVTFGGLLRLTGGRVDAEEVAAGDAARVELELEALQPLTATYRASLRLVGADGARLTDDFDLTDVDHEETWTLGWRVGDQVTIRRGLWVPVSTNPQPYDVRLVIYDAATTDPLEPAGDPPAPSPGGEASVGRLYVTQTRAALPPPAGSFTIASASFGGGDEFDPLELVGLRWHQADPLAGPLAFDLLWQLNGLSGTLHYTEVHLYGATGAVGVSTRAPLFSGSFAMRDWRPGEILSERHELDATALPPGEYVLALGVRDARGRALPVAGGVGEAQLGEVRVAPATSVAHRLTSWWEGARRRLLAGLGRLGAR